MKIGLGIGLGLGILIGSSQVWAGAISLTFGGQTVTRTISDGDLARIRAAEQGLGRGHPANDGELVNLVLQRMISQLGNRVVQWERSQIRDKIAPPVFGQ